MYPHRIRLRGPWETDAAGRVKLPLTQPTAAGTTFLRRFGWRNPLANHERLFLILGDVGRDTGVTLNGHDLGRTGDDSAEFEIGSLVRPRNQLELRPTNALAFRGEIAVEVRATAFLRDITLTAGAGVWQVVGRVVGPPVENLELYLIRAGRHADYRVAESRPDGWPFALSAEPPEAPVAGALPLRLDLIHVSAVWHRHEWPRGDSATVR